MADDYRGGGRDYGWDDQARVGGRYGSSDYGQRGRTRYRDRNPYREEGYYGYDEDRIGGSQDYDYRRSSGSQSGHQGGYQGGYGSFDRDYRGAYRGTGGEREQGYGWREHRDRDRPPGGYQWERDERGRGQEYGGYSFYGDQTGGGYRYGSDYGRGGGRNFDRDRGYGYREDDRNWWDKTTDEVQSWFGDDDAARRRHMDEQRSHRGRGPEGYSRSDDRIREDINDKLTDDWFLDASRITCTVENGEVTLSGYVEHRRDKRRAEDLAEDVSGVRHVQNNIRVEKRDEGRHAYGSQERESAASSSSSGAASSRSSRSAGSAS